MTDPAQEPLPLAEFLTSAALALVQGQAAVARATIELVRELGFTTAAYEGGTPQARTFRFRFSRQETDAATGEAVEREVTMELPLLTLMSLPSLAFEEAHLDFELHIAGFGPPDGSVLGSPGVRPLLVTPASPGGAEVAGSGALRFKLDFKASAMPAGFEQVVGILGAAGGESRTAEAMASSLAPLDVAAPPPKPATSSRHPRRKR